MFPFNIPKWKYKIDMRNKHGWNYIKTYKKYEFNDEIQNHTLNDEQLQIFELLIKQRIRLHILEGTFGSGKTIFIKYFTQYLHMQNKNVLLTTIIGAVALWLFQHAYTTHTQLRIPVHGYLSILSQPNQILKTLKHAHVIIVDEMSTMTNVMLCVIEQCSKWAHDNSNPFTNMLLLLIGDIKQLSTICKHCF